MLFTLCRRLPHATHKTLRVLEALRERAENVIGECQSGIRGVEIGSHELQGSLQAGAGCRGCASHTGQVSIVGGMCFCKAGRGKRRPCQGMKICDELCAVCHVVFPKGQIAGLCERFAI
jgi:hypothetical protein